MGKALVIDGLVVSNPITTVTFTVEVTSLTLDKNSLSLTVGNTGTITATVVTADGTPLDPTFTSGNVSVASVSANGNTATITAVAQGSTTITVKAGSKTQTCNIAVAAAPADEIAAYYAANQTITQTDKNALNALITGMSNAGLWAKVKRFYPMLGTAKSDLLLEMKDNSGKGFSDLPTLSASTNALTVDSDGTMLSGSTIDSMTINTNDMTFVTLCDLTSAANDVYAYDAKFSDDSSKYVDFLVSSSAYRRIIINNLGAAAIGYSENISSIKERSIIFAVDSTSYRLVLNGSTLKTDTFSNETGHALNVPFRFCNRGAGAIYKFFMIMTSLTESEALTLSGLLDTFYQATGKMAAS